MNKLLIERVNYFTGEALLTDDFICEQNYFRETAAIARRSLYTYGIAHGLDVRVVTSKVNPSIVQVEVSPGVAIDAMGRQIILTETSVLQLSEIDTGVNYYITINFHEVYADYNNETGTAGYKRVVEAPQLRYLRNLDQPGIYILLAIASLAADGTLNPLLYRSGNKQRRYVATSVGAVNFITEGAGVGSTLVSAEMLGANLLTRYASIKAKREGENSSYLEFDASRGAFKNMLTVRGNLGVGNDSPSANLQVDAITFEGVGTIVSDNTQVTLKGELPRPCLRAGDSITALASVSGGNAQTRLIQKVDASGTVITVDSAFKNNLVDAPYSYIRSTLARFSASSGSETSLLEVLTDGTIGLGVQAAMNSGGTTAGPNALIITSDRKVGIALNSGTPQVTLDVNGPINATALTTTGLLTTTDINASGAIKAQSFEGNGSKLQGMTKLSYWTKVDPTADLSNLYYNSGNVGIKNSTPAASLSVGGGSAFIGSGVITSLSDLKLVGYNTQFKDQIKIGDILAIGTLNNQISTVVGKPVSDTSLLMASQFEVPIIGSSYSYQAPNGTATPGAGTVSSNGTTLIGTDTQFITQLDDGYTIIIPRFNATSTLEQSQTVAATPTSDVQLTLASAFVGEVTDLPYSYIDPTTKVKTVGKGSISASGTTVTGTGTNFTADFVQGSLIYTNPVQSNSAMPLRWTVASIEDQLNLTLQTDGGLSTVAFTAANSAYMVSTGLLGQFLANDQNGILTPEQEATLPAAMLVLTNSVLDSTEPDQAANTVAINTAYKDVLRKYALQVSGDTNISGDIHGDNLTVKTLFATQAVTVGGAASVAGGLLTVQSTISGVDVATLAVTAGAVQIGTSSNAATLSVSGTISASSDITSVTQVQGQSLNSTGNITASANISTTTGNVQAAKLVGTQLDVAGLNISGNGTAVQFFSAPISYNQSVFVGNAYSETATTDGYVMAVVGPQSFQSGQTYIGTLVGVERDSSNTVVCTMYATTFNAAVVIGTSKGGGNDKTNVSIPGTFTMPISKGNKWTLSLSGVSGTSNLAVTFYWIPLGTGIAPSFSSLTQSAFVPPPSDESTILPTSELFRSPDPAVEINSGALPASDSGLASDVPAVADDLQENPMISTRTADLPEDAEGKPISASPSVNHAAQELHQRLMDYDAYLRSTPANNSSSVQQAIDSRVLDLTDVLGSVTGMSDSPVQRGKFVSDLQKIVCAASPAGGVQKQELEDQNIQDLIATFATATGHVFDAKQQALLADGVRALVQINDSDESRNDLVLIKKNIDTFLQNMQLALPATFSKSEQRLLTRALSRIVGDGRQGESISLATPTFTAAINNPTTSSDPAPTTPVTPIESNANQNSSVPNEPSSIAVQLRQKIESSIGSVVNSDVKPALTQIVETALQGGSVKQASSDLLQKIEHLLPTTLGDAG
ncbi:MAG: hypothetical protein K2P84_05900, partial [Undibacterium sp.]|nr:hypothetical protein [Undibacterium sp.]